MLREDEADQGDPFAGEGLYNPGAEEAHPTEDSPPREEINQEPAEDSKPPAKPKAVSIQEPREKDFAPEENISPSEPLQDYHQDKMRIRMLKHNARVSFDGGVSFMFATRVCVYFELPSGVKPMGCTVVQDLEQVNKLTVTVERSKAIFDPDQVAAALLVTGNPQIDNGLVQAVSEDVDVEREEDNVFFDEKPGVVMHDYQFIIPSDLIVEAGFRMKNDPVATTSRPLNFHPFALIKQSKKRSTPHQSNLLACYLLAWTKEQIEKRNKTPVKGRNHVHAHAARSVNVEQVFLGDYGEDPDTPDASGMPSPKRKRSVSPHFDDDSDMAFS